MRKFRWYMTLGALPLLGDAAFAACSFAPGSGDDAYVCDRGIAVSLSDTSGDNSLLMPTDGTGSITGNVTFGAGRDRVQIDSGTIAGNVGQGGGIDTFVMNGGQITKAPGWMSAQASASSQALPSACTPAWITATTSTAANRNRSAPTSACV